MNTLKELRPNPKFSVVAPKLEQTAPTILTGTHSVVPLILKTHLYTHTFNSYGTF